MGRLLAAIPNVELMTVTVFAAGLIAGRVAGILTGALSFALHSILNAFGPAIPPVLVAQVLLGAVIGLSGGLFRTLSQRNASLFSRAGVFALAGAVLTLMYDLGTTVAFGFSAVAESVGIAALVAAGLPFTGIHVAANAAAFAVVATGLSRQKLAVALLPLILVGFVPCEVLAVDEHEAAMSDSVQIPDSLGVAVDGKEPGTVEVRFWQAPVLDVGEFVRAEDRVSWPGGYGAESLAERMSSFSHVTPGILGTVHPSMSSYLGFPVDVCLDGRVIGEEQIPYLALVESWRSGELSDLLYSSGYDLGRMESFEIIASPFQSVVSPAALSSGNSVMGATWAVPIDPPFSQFMLSQGQEKYSATHFRFGRTLPLNSWITTRAVWMDEGRFREDVSAARSGFAAAAGFPLSDGWEAVLLAKRSESHGSIASTVEDAEEGHRYEETRKDIDLVLAGSGSKTLGELRFFHGDYQSLLEETGEDGISQWRQVYGFQARTGYTSGNVFAEAGVRSNFKHGLEGFETGWWSEYDVYLGASLDGATNRLSGTIHLSDDFPEDLSGNIAYRHSLGGHSDAMLTMERLVWRPDRAAGKYAQELGLDLSPWKVTRASAAFEFQRDALGLRALQSFFVHSDKPEITGNPKGWATGVEVETSPWSFLSLWGLVEARGGEEGAFLSYEHELRSVAAATLSYELPREVRAEFFLRWEKWVDDTDIHDTTGAGIVLSTEGVTLSLKARNLLDEDAEWIRGFPLEERQLFITLDWFFVD